MIYTDGVHMIGNTVEELHQFAESIGLGRHYFENKKSKWTGKSKRHPHYDLMNEEIRKKAYANGAIKVNKRKIVTLCKEFYGEREL